MERTTVSMSAAEVVQSQQEGQQGVIWELGIKKKIRKHKGTELRSSKIKEIELQGHHYLAYIPDI